MNEGENKKTLFLNKRCKLEFTNSFVLPRGTVDDVDEYGIVFRTDQKTSFIAWSDIKRLTPIEE